MCEIVSIKNHKPIYCISCLVCGDTSCSFESYDAYVRKSRDFGNYLCASCRQAILRMKEDMAKGEV